MNAHLEYKGDICPKNQKYGDRRSKRLSDRYRGCKEEIRLKSRLIYQGPLYDCKLSYKMIVYYPNVRADMWAFNQVIFDSLEGILYENDNQLRECTNQKIIKRKEPGFVLEIEPLSD